MVVYLSDNLIVISRKASSVTASSSKGSEVRERRFPTSNFLTKDEQRHRKATQALKVHFLSL